jgi:hypothetical protein
MSGGNLKGAGAPKKEVVKSKWYTIRLEANTYKQWVKLEKTLRRYLIDKCINDAITDNYHTKV